MSHFEIRPFDEVTPDAVAAVLLGLGRLASRGQSTRVGRGDLEVTAELVSALAVLAFGQGEDEDSVEDAGEVDDG